MSRDLPDPKATDHLDPEVEPESIPVGFSSRIDDPAFETFQAEASRWSMIFALIIAAIALVGMPIYGAASGDLHWPTSLYYGLGIGGMFVAIALVGNLKKTRDSTWDGTVIDKSTRQITRYDSASESSVTKTIFQYKVERDDGKIFSHEQEDDATHFTYFEIGDRVRHHRGFPHYEKYDKTSPGVLLCISCGSIKDRIDDECRVCRCPLLK